MKNFKIFISRWLAHDIAILAMDLHYCEMLRETNFYKLHLSKSLTKFSIF